MNTLQKALEVRGLTVNQASKLSGIRYDTLWKHVEGMRGISPEMALRYEETLNIPRTELRPDLWPADITAATPTPPAAPAAEDAVPRVPPPLPVAGTPHADTSATVVA